MKRKIKMKITINFNGYNIYIEGTVDEIAEIIKKLLNKEIDFPIVYVPYGISYPYIQITTNLV